MKGKYREYNKGLILRLIIATNVLIELVYAFFNSTKQILRCAQDDKQAIIECFYNHNTIIIKF